MPLKTYAKILTLALTFTASITFGLVISAGSVSAQDMNYVKHVVKKLASPAFKGRGYVANGDKIAADYIAAEFKKSGLVSLTNNSSYFQEFKLSANTFPGKVVVKLNGKKLIPAVDYLIDASSPAIHGKFKVIPVTRAALDTEEKLPVLINRAKDAFILLDNTITLENRVPLNNRTTQVENITAQRIISANIRALRTKEGLDFKGLIVFSNEKLTWTSLSYQNPRPVIEVNTNKIDPNTIHTLAAEVDNAFIPEYTTRNVTGMIKGTSGSDSTIVITAHYDHLGLMGKKVYFPGANDNASGVSMLLSFVKYYTINKPRYNMVFLAFSGEEIGLMGSKAFTEMPLIELSKIKFLINFDLAGTGEEGIKVVNGTIFRKQFNQLVQLNDQYKLLPKVEIRGEACNSDHCPFYVNGVKCFFIYTQGGISAYHDIYDRAETLPLTAFGHYFQLITKFINWL